jgi:hypothetical protein
VAIDVHGLLQKLIVLGLFIGLKKQFRDRNANENDSQLHLELNGNLLDPGHFRSNLASETSVLSTHAGKLSGNGAGMDQAVYVRR